MQLSMVTGESLATKIVDVEIIVVGEPAADFRAEEPTADLERTTIVGPASAVELVAQASVVLDLTNRQQGIDQVFTLVPIDENGDPVEGITLEHDSVYVTLDINRIENIRRLVVIPQVIGQEQLLILFLE